MSVPKLRFKEFNNRKLEMKNLGEITKWSSGGTPAKDNPEFWNGDIPWISASTMHGTHYEDSDLKITKSGLESGSRLANKNDILLLVRGSILFKRIPVGLAMRDLAFNQDVKSIKVIDGIKSQFILYWFQALENKLLNMVVGTGIGAGKLETSILQAIKLGIPEKKEQTKIANFLATVDEKITQLTRKCELLALYKKGVMHHLFSQELRFKDEVNQDFPEWEEKKLKDIFIIRYGKNYKHLDSGNIPVIGTGGIMTYVDEFLYDKPSVLIGRKGTIDKPQFIEKPFWTVDTLFYTEINKGFVPFFAYLLVLQINWYKFNEATGVPSLNTTAINNIDVFVPSSFQEQTKIANFLTAIDEKITQTQTYLETVKKYKQGLLQQMFI